MSRPAVAFLAWAPSTGRARDLALDLHGESRTIYPRLLRSRRLVPLRYAASAAVTVGYLVARRPRAVVVQNPPVFPSLLALSWVRAFGGRFILDNHPTSFGAKGNRQGARMMGVTRWLARRGDGVLVTTEEWAAVVRSWGARPLVLHEAPLTTTFDPPRPAAGRRLVALFPGTFASDEPVRDLIEAARSVPELDLLITGDPGRAAAGVLDDLPPNVTLTGWLEQLEFAAVLNRCDIVVALTSEPTSVMRSAYEAGYAQRILVITDSPACREFFPDAVHSANTSAGLAMALRSVISDYECLAARLGAIRECQFERWEEQRGLLRHLLGLPPCRPGPREGASATPRPSVDLRGGSSGAEERGAAHEVAS